MNNIITIIASILTVAGTIIGVVTTNKLTLSRSYKEKIWDLRRIAYGTILAELASVEHIYDIGDMYIAEGNFHTYWESKSYKEHQKKINSHMNSVRQVFSTDYL